VTGTFAINPNNSIGENLLGFSSGRIAIASVTSSRFVVTRGATTALPEFFEPLAHLLETIKS
jgi:hypothetical protein